MIVRRIGEGVGDVVRNTNAVPWAIRLRVVWKARADVELRAHRVEVWLRIRLKKRSDPGVRSRGRC